MIGIFKYVFAVVPKLYETVGILVEYVVSNTVADVLRLAYTHVIVVTVPLPAA